MRYDVNVPCSILIKWISSVEQLFKSKFYLFCYKPNIKIKFCTLIKNWSNSYRCHRHFFYQGILLRNGAYFHNISHFSSVSFRYYNTLYKSITYSSTLCISVKQLLWLNTQMQNNKQKNPLPLKKKKEKKNLSAIFSLCTPKGLSVEEKQHMQEVRWDVRKAFSGSICQAGEGKGDRQAEGERVGEGERHPGPRGEGSLGGTACAFQEYCYTSQSVLVGTSSSAAFYTHVWV